jgi:hypothetical protein
LLSLTLAADTVTVLQYPITRHCSLRAGTLPHLIIMMDDTEAAVIRARLEAIVEEEESKATALEQTATAAR